jgi:hypothetical protein
MVKVDLRLHYRNSREKFRKGLEFMNLPQWARNGRDSFWSRHVELATMTEQACERAIEEQLEKWLQEVEAKDGPAAKPENSLTD